MVGSPGFTAENFYKYLKEVQEKANSLFLKDVFSKMIIAHCSSGFKHSLKEILQNPNVSTRIADMSCANETATLDSFFTTLALCDNKVTYGPKSVELALKEMAVETLLISDKLFRSKNVETRKKYVQM